MNVHRGHGEHEDGIQFWPRMGHRCTQIKSESGTTPSENRDWTFSKALRLSHGNPFNSPVSPSRRGHYRFASSHGSCDTASFVARAVASALAMPVRLWDYPSSRSGRRLPSSPGLCSVDRAQADARPHSHRLSHCDRAREGNELPARDAPKHRLLCRAHPPAGSSDPKISECDASSDIRIS